MCYSYKAGPALFAIVRTMIDIRNLPQPCLFYDLYDETDINIIIATHYLAIKKFGKIRYSELESYLLIEKQYSLE